MGLKEKLRQGCERRYRVVSVPFLGDVRIRSLTASEMRRLRNSLRDTEGNIVTQRFEMLDDLLITNCIVDDGGTLEFTEDEALRGELEMDGGSRSVLMEAIKNHTGFVADSEWKPVEAAAKN